LSVKVSGVAGVSRRLITGQRCQPTSKKFLILVMLIK